MSDLAVQAEASVDQELAQLPPALRYLQSWATVVVQDDLSAQKVTEAALYGRTILFWLQEQRDLKAKPLRQLANKITARYKPMVDALDRYHRLLTSRVVAWRAHQRQIVQQQMQAMLATQNVSQQEVQRSAEAVAPQAVPHLVTTYEYSFEIEDASKVPAAYWVIDTERIAREVRSQKDQFNVPGIRVIKREKGVLRK